MVLRGIRIAEVGVRFSLGPLMSLPQHIVIVPDGNRRWAKNKRKPTEFGHLEGAKSTERVFRTALELGIPYLTFWGCSVANVTERPKSEIRALFFLFEQQFKKLLKAKELEGVRVRALGRWEEIFPEKTKKPLRELIGKTQKNKKFNLTFLLAYDGRDEMVAAVRSIKSKKGAKVDRALIKDNLWTRDLPPVDLVIRTGGQPHWSAGLMMWDVAEAQLHFTETLWPEFSPQEFSSIVSGFGEAERRYGK